jgi:DNA-binding NtrC family response regulator
LYYRLSVVTLGIPPLRERNEDIAVLSDSYLDYFRGHIRRNVRRITPEALEALKRYDWPGNVRELVNIIERAMLLASGEEITPDDLPESIRNLREGGSVKANTGASSTASGGTRSSAHIGTTARTSPAVTSSRVAAATDASPRAPGSSRRSSSESATSPEPALPEVWLRKPLRQAREAMLIEFEHNYLHGLLTETGGKIGETARRAGIETRSLFDKMKKHGLRKEDFRPARSG